jgi:hypothetical protein
LCNHKAVTALIGGSREEKAISPSNLTSLLVLALYAEIQVPGLAEPVDRFACQLEQPTDYVGRPSSTVHYCPIRLTLAGMAAVASLFTEWAADNYSRRSGWLVVYEGDQVKWRLAFYDAWCVLYHSNFQPGVAKRASYELKLGLSAAYWEWNGIAIEHHSNLWWEQDAQVRRRALTPPPALLPGPGARRLPSEKVPIPPQILLPTPELGTLSGAPQAPRPPKKALDPKKKPLYAPTISKWYKKGGSIEVLDNGNWKFTDWEHNSVVYEGEEPNFYKYKRQEVDIEDMHGDYDSDYAKANAKAPKGPILEGNTWHHKQNMQTMEEVDYEIHRRFTHYGARHVLKRQANSDPTQSDSTPGTKRVLRKR